VSKTTLNGPSRAEAKRMKRMEKKRRQRRRGVVLFLCVISAVLLAFYFYPSYVEGVWFLHREPVADETDSANPAHVADEKPLSPEEEERLSIVSQLSQRPNEMGKVPIIMYHAISEPESDWVRTPENFKKDLERFYKLGYTLVPFQSYLSGEIDLPRGTSPLILTFDDSTLSQFRLIDGDYQGILGKEFLPQGKMPDPRCAVGILLEFSEKHPDFGCAATFFADFPAPFDVPEEVEQKLNFLLACGMEIGNHTYNHKDLREASPEVVQMEIGKQSNEIFNLTGVKPLSLALPYGNYPRIDEAKKYLAKGEFEGIEYENKGILLVGAEAALSPYHKFLDPLALPRIRGSEEEITKWLKYLDTSKTRYISDGSVHTLSCPEEELDNIAADLPNLYELVIIPTEP